MKKFLFCDIHLFELHQHIYLIENSTMKDIAIVSLDNIVEFLKSYCAAYDINLVKFNCSEDLLANIRADLPDTIIIEGMN